MLSLQLEGRTWLHAWPAGVKLLILAAVSIALLPVGDWHILLAVLAAVLGLYASLGREACAQVVLVKPLLPILAVVFGLHLWLNDWQTGTVAVCRLLAMVLLANAVTMTTTLSAMMDALMPVLAPLRLVGLRPQSLALAVALVIRFVPVIFAEWQAREQAWKARGGGRDSWRLIPAFCLGVLRLATAVGEALDARGFGRSK
ncbi:MAG: energy-coupling factor transporter transmembrane component T family protein [Rhodospirillales bacterium]